MLNSIIASILWRLIEFCYKFGSIQIREAIAKSKAHSRIDKQVKALKAVVFEKKGTHSKQEIIDAARDLIRAHDS